VRDGKAAIGAAGERDGAAADRAASLLQKPLTEAGPVLELLADDRSGSGVREAPSVLVILGNGPDGEAALVAPGGSLPGEWDPPGRTRDELCSVATRWSADLLGLTRVPFVILAAEINGALCGGALGKRVRVAVCASMDRDVPTTAGAGGALGATVVASQADLRACTAAISWAWAPFELFDGWTIQPAVAAAVLAVGAHRPKDLRRNTARGPPEPGARPRQLSAEAVAARRARFFAA